MLACHVWLSVEFFVRHGFTLEVTSDGGRTAVRDGQRHDLPPECGHEDCPPHPTVMIELKEAA